MGGQRSGQNGRLLGMCGVGRRAGHASLSPDWWLCRGQWQAAFLRCVCMGWEKRVLRMSTAAGNNGITEAAAATSPPAPAPLIFRICCSCTAI